MADASHLFPVVYAFLDKVEFKKTKKAFRKEANLKKKVDKEAADLFKVYEAYLKSKSKSESNDNHQVEESSSDSSSSSKESQEEKEEEEKEEESSEEQKPKSKKKKKDKKKGSGKREKKNKKRKRGSESKEGNKGAADALVIKSAKDRAGLSYATIEENTVASGAENGLSQGTKKKRRNSSTRFQRVKENEVYFVDPRLSDNSYERNIGQQGWGAKANDVLGRVRGRNFRHEKTKKKRGTYKGGQINPYQVNSIKFEFE